jgi:ferredoxin-type protein NapF
MSGRPAIAVRRTRPLRRWRLLGRGLVLAAAILLLGPLSDRGGGPAWFAGLSPYVAGGAIVATRALHAMAWLGLLVGLVVCVRRRFFCRWLCPAGLLLDGVGKVACRCGSRPARRGKLGAWLLWITVGGAVFGFPLFLWLDPLAIFSAAASIPHPDAGLARWYAGGILVAIVVVDLVRPGTWCRQVCPLGAFQDVVHDGPRSMFRRMREKRQPGAEAKRGRGISRRAWLGLAGGGVSAIALPSVKGGSRRVLRPPGAVDDPTFNGVCLRCGDCVRACPAGIIGNAGTEAGWAGIFTPVVSFAADYCREDCVRCGDVCPSGALRRVPLEEKGRARIGLPKVDMDICLLGEERECSLCRDWCPYGAIRYVFCEDDYLVHPRIDPELCNGCGACEAQCPVAPVKAIRVELIANRDGSGGGIAVDKN